MIAQNRHLSVEDAHDHIEQVFLKWHGRDRLRVGDIQKVDTNTIVAEIVTSEGSFVDRLTIDCCTGAIKRRQPDRDAQIQ